MLSEAGTIVYLPEFQPAVLTRWNGERRLRLSDRFMDPPGEAKPDWWIIAEVAKKMGFSGYDWQDENEIFVATTGLPKAIVHGHGGTVIDATLVDTSG